MVSVTSEYKMFFKIGGFAIIVLGIIGSIFGATQVGVVFLIAGVLASLFTGGMLLFCYEVLDILENISLNTATTAEELKTSKDKE
ncbi:MAG: hypothetical protein J6H31_14740 [Butyrivibrio sp.]|nr:hypothetical protein [Butyrivibrio sp.]